MDISFELLDKQLQSLKSESKPSFELQRNVLRSIRKSQIERWDVVTLIAPSFLKDYGSKLDEGEYWDIHEQLVVAALHMGQDSLAKSTLDAIIKQFGTSGMRIKKLVALMLEAQKQYTEADKIYKDILQLEPANHYAMKRQIAMVKARGKILDAINLLNDYLQIFCGDMEAWQELAELSISCSMLKQASFCYEELILIAPQNHHFHIRYAEILYSLGGYDNLKLARKYFAKALELSDCDSNRALYGILISAQAISRTSKGKQEKENKQICDWAYSQLSNKYQTCSGSQFKVFQTAFGKDLEK